MASTRPGRASRPGIFVALEGGEGAGKSTQIQLLAAWLADRGHDVVVTREPGATPAGERIRALLLDPTTELDEHAEALLYAADRAEHAARVVRPALARGTVVLSDRYIDSSVAYQGYGRGLDPDVVSRISRWATGELVPDLTVLLDLPVAAARQRLLARGGTDRLESEADAFHERVRSGFRRVAAADPARYEVVDGSAEVEQVAEQVRGAVEQLLPAQTCAGAAGPPR
jgi:dTMP kinase